MGSDAARALQFFLVVRARIAAAENRPDRVAALVEEALAIDFEAARMYPGMLWWLTFALVELGYGDRAYSSWSATASFPGTTSRSRLPTDTCSKLRIGWRRSATSRPRPKCVSWRFVSSVAT